MRKLLPLVLALGLTGCSGVPLVSSGLSAEPSVASAEALPEPAALPPARPVRPVQRVARRKSVFHVAAPKAAVEPAASADDEPADRAARALDREANRLDSAARQVTNSICRGC